MYRILVINPGSTSTKVALYADEERVWQENIEHPAAQISRFAKIYDQLDMRYEVVMDLLEKKACPPASLSAVVARGGLLPPLPSGAYLVNEDMIHVLRDRPMNHHASNLGAAIAYRIAQPLGIPAYIYDPVTVDEMIDVVRITGLKEVLQFGQGHNLNMRAAALEYCRRTGTDYRSVNLIVAHLGGGISISLQSSGRIIDMVSDEEGPFSPERAGLIPNFKLLRLVYKDPNNTYESMMRLLQRKGGLMSHFGTTDTVAVESMAKSGDKYARLVYGAMALNVAKHIAALSTVVYGKVHQIILTGGIAYSKTFTAAVAERVSYLAPVYVLPGEKEMEALAKGALRVLSGQEEAQVYDSSVQRPLLSIDRLPD